jgi:hypothetical protein
VTNETTTYSKKQRILADALDGLDQVVFQMQPVLGRVELGQKRIELLALLDNRCENLSAFGMLVAIEAVASKVRALHSKRHGMSESMPLHDAYQRLAIDCNQVPYHISECITDCTIAIDTLLEVVQELGIDSQ